MERDIWISACYLPGSTNVEADRISSLQSITNTYNSGYSVHTAISINVVGSKYKTIKQDRKILWDFLMNKFIN